MGSPTDQQPPAPLSDSDEMALLQIIDERLRALTAEENELKMLRARLLARVRPEGVSDDRAA